MENMITTSVAEIDASEDLGFDSTLSHIQDHARKAFILTPRLFVTNVSGDDVWNVFQTSLRELAGDTAAQHLNCHTCKDVVRKAGNVVAINELGAVIPIMWPHDIDDTILGKVYADVYAYVAEAKIVSVWMSDVAQIGTQTTTSKSGHMWTHFHVPLPGYAMANGQVDTANQIMAKSKERFRILMNDETGIHRIKMETFDTVVRLLEADELYRSDNFLAPAKFHQSVKRSFVDKTFSKALIWRELITKPNGWENLNSTMIGQLYDRIGMERDLDDIKRWWNSATDPRRFQRAQSMPSDGELARAEVIIEKLGAKDSLARRFATLEDLRLIWSPKDIKADESTVKGGVFSSLKSTPSSVSLSEKYTLTPKRIDWDKFRTTILPTADNIQIHVPNAGGFAALLTATHADAPPIMSWDKEGDRYPISWYTYHAVRPAANWNLIPSTLTKVSGITQLPGHSDLVILVIDGCRDSNTKQGLGLFAEDLRPEFHEIRKTMEAFSLNGELDGTPEGSACGWILGKNSCGITLRVTTGKEKRDYTIDRFD